MRGRENKSDEAKSQGGTRASRRRKNGPESGDCRTYITDLNTDIKNKTFVTTDTKNKIICQETSLLKVSKPMSPNPSESSALLNNHMKSSCTTPDNSSVENNCSSKDIVHMLTNLDPVQLREENLHLKELLISQLDLIQQQSETILSKDKQLKDLRMENENLHQRLERMQRRPGRRDTDSPTRTRDKASKDPRKRAVGDMAPEEQVVVQNKRIKQEVVEPQELLQPPQEELDSTIRVDMPEYAVIDELKDEIYDEVDDLFRKVEEEEDTAVPRLSDSNVVVTPASAGETETPVGVREKRVQKPKRERPKSRKNRKCSSVIMPYGGKAEQVLQTPYHYFIGCRNDIVNVDDKLNEVAVLQRGVEVPKFREDATYDKKMSKIQSSNKNPYAGGKSKDDLEMMDDAVFIKRHEKPEALEKRTKKRDIQRQRERIYCEKMRLRERNRTHGNKKVQLNSLLPTPEGALYIEKVENDKVPVTAFGESVLAFDQTPFSLPWLEKKSVNKKRRHATVF